MSSIALGLALWVVTLSMVNQSERASAPQAQLSFLASATGTAFSAEYERRDVSGQLHHGRVFRSASGKQRDEFDLHSRVAAIWDPSTKTALLLDAVSGALLDTSAQPGPHSPPAAMVGPAPSIADELGVREIEGLPARGYRVTVGDTASEYWVSTQLGVVLLEKRIAPIGETVWLRLFGIRLAEPPAELFEPKNQSVPGRTKVSRLRSRLSEWWASWR